MEPFKSEGVSRCLCQKCRLTKWLGPADITLHLCRNGFKDGYWMWTEQEKVDKQGINQSASNLNRFDGRSTRVQVVRELNMKEMTWEGNQERYNEILFVATSVMELEEAEQEPNPEAKRFYHLLESAAKPLFEGCFHSELSVCVTMMSIKSESNYIQKSFDKWTTLCNDLVSVGTTGIPRNHYEAKKLVSKLGLNLVKIYCCLNGCMLYYKRDIDLTECRFCRSPRFQVEREQIGKRRLKRVSMKRMHYLPLIHMLKRLYTSMCSAPHMTWHSNNKRDDEIMTHPSHGEAWKHFD
ncbi:uncharacterized protein LOC107612011 [Arachis ipaensis]|uniref:uncharacterized protein LOC107612011 n=1 Tax=Arachis ipaensis TaxID=130454 RepID=UPI0007AF8026|nr:uncharacterized protein LOC107612011 [Arachis ipaensis]XP_025628632.1 uncharacterized protein LOC112721821 [Arachis hypogaea]